MRRLFPTHTRASTSLSSSICSTKHHPHQVSDIKKIARKITDLDIYLKYISYGIEPELQALIKLSYLPIGIAIFPPNN